MNNEIVQHVRKAAKARTIIVEELPSLGIRDADARILTTMQHLSGDTANIPQADANPVTLSDLQAIPNIQPELKKEIDIIEASDKEIASSGINAENITKSADADKAIIQILPNYSQRIQSMLTSFLVNHRGKLIQLAGAIGLTGVAALKYLASVDHSKGVDWRHSSAHGGKSKRRARKKRGTRKYR